MTVGQELANLLGNIAFYQYRRWMEEGDAKKAQTDQMMKLIRNVGIAVNPTVFSDPALSGALEKYYGKDQFEMLKTLAQGDQKAGTPSFMDLMAGTKVLGRRVDQATGERPLLGQAGPPVTVGGPTEEDIRTGKTGYPPMQIPGQPQSPTPLTDQLPQPQMEIPVPNITASGDISVSYEENPEYESFKRAQWHEAYDYFHNKMMMRKPDAYVRAYAHTGFAKKVDLSDLDMTDQEKEEVWYNVFSTFNRDTNLTKALSKQLQLAEGSVALQNAQRMKAALIASDTIGGFVPDAFKPFMYGTQFLEHEEDLDYQDRLKKQQLNAEYQDMLRKPIPVATARDLGLPYGTSMQNAIDQKLTPLTTKAQGNLNEIDNALQLLDQLEALSTRVHKSPGGTERLIEGLSQWGEYYTQKDVDVALYQRFKEGMLSVGARNVGSERGVLTEFDIQRVRAIFPSLWDSEEFAVGAFKEIRDILMERREDALRPPTAQAYRRRRAKERWQKEGQQIDSLIVGKIYRMKDKSIRVFRGLDKEGNKLWQILRPIQ